MPSARIGQAWRVKPPGVQPLSQALMMTPQACQRQAYQSPLVPDQSQTQSCVCHQAKQRFLMARAQIVRRSLLNWFSRGGLRTNSASAFTSRCQSPDHEYGMDGDASKPGLKRPGKCWPKTSFPTSGPRVKRYRSETTTASTFRRRV